jgi:TolB protein
VYLRIYTKTFQRIDIDVYPFAAEGGAADGKISEAMASVISNDLWMSGFFSVTDPLRGKVNVKSGAPAADGAAGSRALAAVSGKYFTSGSNITIQPHVIDLASGRTILKNDYSDAAARQRYILHKISDDIVYSLTGERGIARSKIAFVKDKGENVKEIAVMDYDGHNVVELTNNRSINLSPAWSPDGGKICFSTFKDNNLDLYVMNLHTNTLSRLSNVQGLNSAAAWSPDGANIALTLSQDGNAEIYILEVEKKKLRRLTYNNAIDSSPSWSPSNREMAFTSDRSGTPQIYIMDSDGLNVRRLTFEGSYNDSPAWSPRGDKIAFVSRTASGFDIYTIDVTGENLMRLTDSSGSNEDPSWSPNGFALIFSSNRSGRKAIYSMFWDGSDQKPITSGGTHYMPAWSPRIN